jgi:beta-fructofuranosidase
MLNTTTPTRRHAHGLALGLTAFVFAACPVAASEPFPHDNASKAPRFTYSRTLEAQERELLADPLLRRMNESRRRLTADPHRPAYHYVNPEGNLNDPNGLCFWRGRWHLFYQAYPPEDPRQHWGHAVSDDLIHWRDLPLAIYPSPEQACFSGSCLVEDDRVIAIYHGTELGTMVAVADDPLLLNWKKITGRAVIPIAKPGDPPLPYNVFDPCIWKKDGMYYALTAGSRGGKQLRSVFLHRSQDLVSWEHLHPFLENDNYGLVGDDGACPYFWPIGDRHVLLHFSHMSGGKYLLGHYDRQRDMFSVTDGGSFNFGAFGPSGVHAPSASPDGTGGVVVIFNMNEGKPTQGWNRIMSLPRRLTLRKDGIFNPLHIEPAGNIESLRGTHTRIEAMQLPANQEVVLQGVRGDALEIIAEIAPQPWQTVELNVLRSSGGEELTRIQIFRDRGFRMGQVPLPCVVSLDTSRASIAPDVRSRPPETAQVELAPEEPLTLRVFVDRSVVEVFVNDRQCLAARVYPELRESVGVSLRSQGTTSLVRCIDAWQMKTIYEVTQ